MTTHDIHRRHNLSHLCWQFTGADVTFENGNGPTPTASNIIVVDSNTITAEVTAKSGGPPRNRMWDVRVTNPDGASDVLVDGFTVIP